MEGSTRARLRTWLAPSRAAIPRRRRALAGAFAGAMAAFVAAFAVGAFVAAEPAPIGAQASVPALLSAASSDLAARIASDGPGLRWSVTQDQVLETTEGRSTLVVNTTSRGVARGTGFTQEIRRAADKASVHDFDRSTFGFGTVVSGDQVWRNEGDGFFAIERARIPGLGMDPLTLSRLPTLLRRLTGVSDLGQDTIDGVAASHFSAKADVVDWPGVVASDGLALTESPFTVEVWIDTGGRLMRLSGLTRNVAWTDGSLWIRTTVTFATDVPATLDQPLPALVGTPQPKP